MKQKKFPLFRRLIMLVFGLITGLGLVFIIITYLSTTYYHEASTQLLNKDVAAHIAKFTSPFERTGVNPAKADSVFYNAMVINPGAEVYFLDTTGKVIAYHASEKAIAAWQVDLLPVKKYIQDKGEKYGKGTDPRDPGDPKIFSAAPVENQEYSLGYIYVILASEQSKSMLSVILGNEILKLAVQSVIAIILLSALLSFLYLRSFRRNYEHTIEVLERFEKGDYSARLNLRSGNELEPIAHAFNDMADLLASTINRLTLSEQERKNFIATISHDLRTPLSIARGYFETLMLKQEKGPLSGEDQERFSQLIYGNILQIEKMVKQLFELSKMEAVEFTLNREPFVFSEIVQEAVGMFQLLAAEKGVTLRCSENTQHVWIDADISMMERVVQNLVENALKSTPEGGSIVCSMSVADQELVFSIKNDAPPLPDDLLQWINQYESEEQLLNQRPSQLGLGLLIIQRILHLHGTSLKAGVENNRNCFSLTMPVHTLATRL